VKDSLEFGMALDPRLAARLALLSPAKRSFIEQRMRAARSAENTSIVTPILNAGAAPLSFAQEDLWHMEQSAPGSSTYNVPRAMRIVGPLDLDVLQASLAALVVRHEVLRTTVEAVAGELRAVVQTPSQPSMRVLDLRACAPIEREAQLDRVLREAAIEPFDLTRDLLLRATVVVLGAEEHAVALLSHHFASDESSARILFADFAALYSGLQAGKPIAWPPTALKYSDFSTWQRAYWRGQQLDELVSLWQVQLEAAPERLELPLDRQRPAFPSFAGERRTYRFSPALTQRVVELGIAHGATSFVTLLAAFQTLLHRYNGQDDIYVGSVFTGRRSGDFGDVLGYFSNVLPLGAHFASDPTFVELLAQVRETHLFALDHSDVPFERLAAEIGTRSRTAPPATFSAMFIMTAEGPAVPVLPRLSLEPISIDCGAAKLDLTVGASITDQGLRLSVEYRTQLFDGSTIDRMLENFETLLEGISGNPSRRVSRLPLLGQTELRLIANPEATAVPKHADSTVVDLLRAQAGRTPLAIAVECGADVLTYSELDARAEQLGAYLRARGVGPNVIVAVCVERSVDMVVAVLGVQRAGGAYLPIDPSLPRARIAFMLDDAATSLVVTQSALHDRLPPDVPMLSLDGTWEAIQSEPRTVPAPAIYPQHLAYIIYTSGTTGRPKGVQIEHRNLLNFVTAMQSVVRVQPGDAIVAAYSLSFDPWGEEIYLSLAYGARVVVAPFDTTSDPKVLAALYDCVKPTIAVAPPAIWRMLIEASWQGSPGMRIRSGGEALPPQLADQLLDRADEVWNVYGPTEATVVSTVARIERGTAISIGTPLPNVTTYILDEHLQSLPVGVQGEIYIGGESVGRGYLNRPELTAERFVPDPFGPLSDARLYRTGDLARRRADGSIDYLGRIDQQVKLRGLRIELGEIENALREHPALVDAAVLMVPDQSGEPTLVAYYVARDRDLGELSASVRDHLANLMPRYMIPTHLVALDALPLTSNGKSDRNALAQRDLTIVISGETFVAPRTQTEERIAQIWKQVMRCEHLGVHDDFFDLGGHSILAMRVVSRICAAFGVRVPLVAMFDLPTVAALARFVDETISPQAILNPALSSSPASLTNESEISINNLLHHQLRLIWLKLLGAAEVGIGDNFFTIGGDSPMAAVLLALVKDETGKTVSLARFLENPTISHLANLILESRGSEAGFPLLALTTTGSRPPVFFAHSDLNGGGFYTRKFARKLGSDQPFYILAPHGTNGEACSATIQEMACDYIAAMRAVRPNGPYVLGGFCSGGLVALEVARRLRLEGVDILNVILLDVPSGNASLARLASAIDATTAVLRLPEKARSAVCAVFGKSAARGRGLSAALRRAARLTRAGGIHALSDRLLGGPLKQVWVHAEYPWLEPFWRGVTRAHIPRPYEGRITLLASEQYRSIGSGTIVRRWNAVSRLLSLYEVPGEHLTSITQFADQTATVFARVVQGEAQRRPSEDVS
jgi:amino acid adenylation domain-containing protein